MTENTQSSPPREVGADLQDPSLFQRILAWVGRRGRTRNGEDSIRETLEELIEERPEGLETINADERLLIGNVLNLRDVIAADVMVPRAEIVAIEASAPFEDLIALMIREAHSRVPVYRGTLDDVLGMIHIKDVLAHVGSDKPLELLDVVRKVLFVSPTMRVLDLLLQMRLARVHMALVVDEYGGVDGLVTIEDLVEEIVGDIQDEHDAEDVVMIDRPDGSIIADARTELESLEDRVGRVLTEDERADDIHTLGGLIFTMLHRVPARGEIVSHSSGLEFEIIDADPRRIKRVRIRNLSALKTASGREHP
ncbi:MAG: hemolysin family protein [Alphaproteobacteria bacterium]|nr:hemolysin family protein [Alphaproteobacteria bacterium]